MAMTQVEKREAGCTIATLGILCVCLFIVGMAADEGWRRSAVRHGAAHYDATSGRFKWNDEAQSEASK